MGSTMPYGQKIASIITSSRLNQQSSSVVITLNEASEPCYHQRQGRSLDGPISGCVFENDTKCQPNGVTLRCQKSNNKTLTELSFLKSAVPNHNGNLKSILSSHDLMLPGRTYPPFAAIIINNGRGSPHSILALHMAVEKGDPLP